VTAELSDLASAIVDRAASGEDVEAFLTHERELEVRVFGGEVDSLSSAEPRGAGVRVVSDHRVGFAYTTELTEDGLDRLVASARENAAHATPRRWKRSISPSSWSARRADSTPK
jgi:PmbA protein